MNKIIHLYCQTLLPDKSRTNGLLTPLYSAPYTSTGRHPAPSSLIAGHKILGYVRKRKCSEGLGGIIRTEGIYFLWKLGMRQKTNHVISHHTQSGPIPTSMPNMQPHPVFAKCLTSQDLFI